MFSISGFAQREGNPENWCRGGAFPFDTEEFKIGTVKGSKGEKVFFYNDFTDDCPMSEKCREKAYLVPGDKVVVSRTFKDFACTWYVPAKGQPTTSWIKADSLTFTAANAKPKLSEWLGAWKFASNSISLTQNKLAGYLNVTGDAVWKGLGDNVHIGELDDRGQPKGNLLKIGDADPSEYGCKVTMHLVNGFLVVADNTHCGGANVSFSGVYKKKK